MADGLETDRLPKLRSLGGGTMSYIKNVYVGVLEELDTMDPSEIRHLINQGIITEDDVTEHFDYARWEKDHDQS